MTFVKTSSLLLRNAWKRRGHKLVAPTPRIACRSSPHSSQNVPLSTQANSEGEDPQPLFLWLGETESSSSSAPSLLLPVKRPFVPTVTTVDDVLEQVHAHYDRDTQFVGGMGEDDPGVCFASVNMESLFYSKLIQEAIADVKEERHGVPFSIFTSGLLPSEAENDDLPPLSELGIQSLQVSLFAGSPSAYAKASGNSERDFGQVCGFIVDAVEQTGVVVECWVTEEHAASARDLALSLGAQNVHTI